MLLNIEWVNNEIKEEINTYLETNEYENTTSQNLWDTGNTILRGKFIALQAYLKKQEKTQINNLTSYLKELEKQDSTKKLLELINEFSTVAGYKINIQKSAAFLYANNELTEKEIKKNNHVNNCFKKNKKSWNKFNQDVKDMYLEYYKALKKEIEDTSK